MPWRLLSLLVLLVTNAEANPRPLFPDPAEKLRTQTLLELGWIGGHLKSGQTDFALFPENGGFFIKSKYLPDTEAQLLYPRGLEYF